MHTKTDKPNDNKSRAAVNSLINKMKSRNIRYIDCFTCKVMSIKHHILLLFTIYTLLPECKPIAKSATSTNKVKERKSHIYKIIKYWVSGSIPTGNIINNINI